ncbi:MAG: ATP-binding protein [Rickettsiales bacterium]|nr:ATP-binding protein [Rickettsiales bacterium]
MTEQYKRWMTKPLKSALNDRRVVIVSGARQTGKSTLTEQVGNSDFDYLTLDDNKLLDLALSDPKGFVTTDVKTLVIDEIQKAPKIIPEIKMIVDKNNRNGQFLLTGSVNLQTMPSATESLAGRVKNIRLHPLAQGEILRRQPKFLERAFNGNFPTMIKGYDKKAIFELAFRGGYPEAVRQTTPAKQRSWHRDYIKTLIEYDLADIANIRRKDALEELLPILAAWSGKFMDYNAIGASLSLTKPTLESYINWLLALFIFDKVSPWLKTDYDRVGRKAKVYASDTGLMTYMLGWNFDDVMRDVDKSGKLMETFVFGELSAQINLTDEYSLYQYRDRERREIDFLVERDDGVVLGIEVKAGHNVATTDFANQEWFRDNILKNKKKYIGIVLYSGDRTIKYSNGMMAVPIAALWGE